MRSLASLALVLLLLVGVLSGVASLFLYEKHMYRPDGSGLLAAAVFAIGSAISFGQLANSANRNDKTN